MKQAWHTWPSSRKDIFFLWLSQTTLCTCIQSQSTFQRPSSTKDQGRQLKQPPIKIGTYIWISLFTCKESGQPCACIFTARSAHRGRRKKGIASPSTTDHYVFILVFSPLPPPQLPAFFAKKPLISQQSLLKECTSFSSSSQSFLRARFYTWWVQLHQKKHGIEPVADDGS